MCVTIYKRVSLYGKFETIQFELSTDFEQIEPEFYLDVWSQNYN
jgi:hypothetical protein